MTLLTKTIRRQLLQQFDRREWVIELTSWGINFRAKRTRKQFGITWDSIWTRAMIQEAERVMQEKKARRKKAA